MSQVCCTESISDHTIDKRVSNFFTIGPSGQVISPSFGLPDPPPRFAPLWRGFPGVNLVARCAPGRKVMMTIVVDWKGALRAPNAHRVTRAPSRSPGWEAAGMGHVAAELSARKSGSAWDGTVVLRAGGPHKGPDGGGTLWTHVVILWTPSRDGVVHERTGVYDKACLLPSAHSRALRHRCFGQGGAQPWRPATLTPPLPAPIPALGRWGLSPNHFPDPPSSPSLVTVEPDVMTGRPPGSARRPAVRSKAEWRSEGPMNPSPSRSQYGPRPPDPSVSVGGARGGGTDRQRSRGGGGQV